MNRSNEPSVYAVIPARGGSKGIARKNLKHLRGRPLLWYAIRAASKSARVDRVIVSTDDEEIASIAKDCGAEVPFMRPPQYATDTASSLSVIRHALSWLGVNEGTRPDAVAILPPTSPLRTAEQIDAVVDLLRSSEKDTALTVVPVRDHPYFIYTPGVDGALKELIEMDEKPLRRQELPPFVTHSQSIVVSRSSYLLSCPETAPIFNLRSMVGHPIDRTSALDIDGPEDLRLAELLLEDRNAEVRP